MQLQDYRETKNGQVQVLPRGTIQCAYVLLAAEDLEWFITKLDAWFERRDDVGLVGQGEMQKSEQAFILLEWHEHTIDPLFISFLDHDDRIDAYSISTREGA